LLELGADLEYFLARYWRYGGVRTHNKPVVNSGSEIKNGIHESPIKLTQKLWVSEIIEGAGNNCSCMVKSIYSRFVSIDSNHKDEEAHVRVHEVTRVSADLSKRLLV
jgi:hypothetical protein